MKINQKLLKKYFSKTNFPEEKQVLNYLSAEDSDLTPLEELLEQEKENIVPQEIPPVMLKTLIYRIRKATYSNFLKPVKAVKLMWWYSAAAVLLPIVWFITFSLREQLAKPVNSSVATTMWKTVVNNESKTKIARLPDGSEIWLSPKSSFSYMPEQYGVQNRIIRMEGEGFFDVKTDLQHPFIVQHEPINIQVLGTAFNVEAYNDEANIRVSLVRGKIAVKKSNTSSSAPLQILHPGQQLIYQYKDGRMVVKSLLYNNEATWKQGWMILDDVPLSVALQRLERMHNTTIVVPEHISLTGKKVTALIKGGTLTEKLYNILFVHRLEYEIKKDTIYIHKNFK